MMAQHPAGGMPFNMNQSMGMPHNNGGQSMPNPAQMPPGMHPGMMGVGPGVGQMMGMPNNMQPGGPNIQAMQHLQPHQGMFGGANNMQYNPQLMQMRMNPQQQQHALMQQQQQQQQMKMAAQQGQGHPVMAQAGHMVPPQFMNNQGMRLNLPAGLQNQFLQQQQQQQQQQGRDPQNQMMQRNMANAQNPAQQQAQQGAQAAALPAGGQPMRPQGSMQGGINAQASQQQQPNNPSDQPSQPGQQQQPPTSQQNMPPPTTGPTDQSHAAPSRPPTQPNPGQQQPNPNQPQQGPPNGPQNAQAARPQQMAAGHNDMLKQQILAQQQHNQTRLRQHMMIQQQQMSNAANLQQRLMSFFEQLSNFRGKQSPEMIARFVETWFGPDATLRMTLWDSDKDVRQDFEIPKAVLAQFFSAQYESGVEQLQINFASINPTSYPTGQFHVESPSLTCCYWYSGSSIQVVAKGTMRAIIGQTGRIDMLDLAFERHDEYILSAPFRKAQQETVKSPEINKSPKAVKASAKQKQQARQNPETFTVESNILPKSPVRTDGVTERVKVLLEMTHCFNQMRDLIDFAHQSKNYSANNAVEQVNQRLTNGMHPGGPMMPNQMQFLQNPHLNFAGNGNPMNQPPGMRTPSMNGPQQFNSPAHAGLALPGNTNSPHMRNSPMGGVAMQHQLSHQGNMSNASGSSNVSPNVQSKKRRASQVKQEGPEDGGQTNGESKTKTPKIGGKRQKGQG